MPKRKEFPALGEAIFDARAKKEEDVSDMVAMKDKCAELRSKMIEDGSRDEMKL